MDASQRGAIGRRLRRWGMGTLLLPLLGCSLDGLLKNGQLPPEVTDPAITKTPAGALTVYRGAIVQLQAAFGGLNANPLGVGPNVTAGAFAFVSVTGRISDELDGGTAAGNDLVDRRLLLGQNSSDIQSAYNVLQVTRGQAGQAIGLLQSYVPETPALAGHMYAVQAFTEIFLAELFCSGIPLSTIDYNGDYTYRPGSTTAQVFNHALALFDTGMTLAADSARFVNLIRVGEGRALLALGRYAEAAAAVAQVPDDYSYALHYSNATVDALNFLYTDAGLVRFSEANVEGFNGLDYRSSGDPRTAFVAVSGGTVYRPTKYNTLGTSPIVLASGIEARLIEAEAALQAGDASTWLSTLNRLRAGPETFVPADTIVDTLGVTGCLSYPDYCGGPNGPAGDTPDRGLPLNFPPAGYGVADSFKIAVTPEITSTCYNNSWYTPCWPDGDSTTVIVFVRPEQTTTAPGVGGVAGLAALTDPGTPEARVNRMFRERAFWLYLTGHRQGDLRRLVRQYGRSANQVYPVGIYPSGGTYGTDVVAPIPETEKTLNPLFTGCASTGA